MRILRTMPALGQERIPFEGGPMDGEAFLFRPPFKPHVYWKNRNATYEVYVLEQSVYGWTYRHVPGAEVRPA